MVLVQEILVFPYWESCLWFFGRYLVAGTWTLAIMLRTFGVQVQRHARKDHPISMYQLVSSNYNFAISGSLMYAFDGDFRQKILDLWKSVTTPHACFNKLGVFFGVSLKQLPCPQYGP